MAASRAYSASVLVVLCTILLAACKTSSDGLATVSDDSSLGGGGTGAGASGGTASGGSGDVDSGRPPVVQCDRPEKQRDLGVACDCDQQCSSGKCVDGVCCSGACDGTCQACNVPGKMGSCSPIPAGMLPVVKDQCKRDDVATCGSDGTCDGNGSCRRFPDGTSCVKGMCDGATVKGAKVCKTGKCEAGPNTVCAPFGCSAGSAQCFDGCKDDTECAQGQQCKNGSCGKKNLGAQCGGSAECDSGFCADGVCCNTTCNGACVSCNQLSKMGECAPVLKDQPDPHSVCKDDGAPNCGASGTCDGGGGCAKYGPTTICRAARCEGANLLPASSCDGKGSCRAGNQVPCAPFSCVGNACKATCASDGDCSGGNVCKNGSCGLRGNGQVCSTQSQCLSNFCVDGVCCENACNGQCKFCASSQALGSCINVAASTPDPRAAAGVTDPTRVCLAQDATSCGRNGLCNGNAGCQVWDSKTMCTPQSCATGTNTYSEPKMCDGFGVCKAQGSQTCAPYKCNGPSCGNACGSDNDCVPPNACVSGKCGPKPSGSLCNNDNECSSKFCRQGVCCQTDCKGSCFSCSLSNSRGNCAAVPAGLSDPANVCKDDGVASCDRDGKCDGTGKCRLYASGQVCAGATCAAGSATGLSACNGTGNCVKGAVRTCGAFKCNAEGTACYESCVDNNQCVTGRVCQGSSCGKKPNGAACPAGAGDCTSGQCFQGFCCNAQCDGICKSCALQGKEGTCDNIPKGAPDLAARCVAAAPATCGNDGFCNGAGVCEKFDATVDCRNQSCPADSTTQVLSAKCDGAGNCPALKTRDCQLIKCDAATNACLTGCMTDSQCVSSSFCDVATMSCGGLKDNGTACTAGNQCKSAKCVEGVCCGGLAVGANSCPACQSCAVVGQAGSCRALPAGPTGAGSCTAGVGVCGQQQCNGAGACVAANPVGTSCGTPACVGESQVQAQACNATGDCANAGAPTQCPGSFRCAAGACKTSCTPDTQAADCITGKVCSAGICVTPKTPNGGACAATDECVSGYCSGASGGGGGVCCDTACGGACKSCKLTGNVGTCSNVPAGTPDNSCAATVTANACNYGVCGTAGSCAALSCASTCSPDETSAMGSTCNGTMTCGTTTTVCMSGFKCMGTGCLTQCTLDTQCQSGYFCQNNTPSDVATYQKCQPKKAPQAGLACTRNGECTNATCAQGYCCDSTCTDTCKTCAGAMLGVCSSVAAGGPHPACLAAPPSDLCGLDGKCNGSATAPACTFKTGVCGMSACSADKTQKDVPLTCDGAGSCTVEGSGTACVPLLEQCTAGACTAIIPPPVVP